jgi:hypothetical protein
MEVNIRDASRVAAIVVTGLMLSGCGSYSLQAGREDAIISSTRYDHLSCEDVAAQRDQMAAKYDLPSDVTPKPMRESAVPGLGPLIPDLRSRKTAVTDLAIGHIHAMNESMRRRGC